MIEVGHFKQSIILLKTNLVFILEFYVGSSVAVTVTDKNSPHPNKVSLWLFSVNLLRKIQDGYNHKYRQF